MYLCLAYYGIIIPVQGSDSEYSASTKATRTLDYFKGSRVHCKVAQRQMRQGTVDEIVRFYRSNCGHGQTYVVADDSTALVGIDLSAGVASDIKHTGVIFLQASFEICGLDYDSNVEYDIPLLSQKNIFVIDEYFRNSFSLYTFY